jgi:hypothetical protein
MHNADMAGGSFDPDLIERRRVWLSEYLSQILCTPALATSRPVYIFLQSNATGVGGKDALGTAASSYSISSSAPATPRNGFDHATPTLWGSQTLSNLWGSQSMKNITSDRAAALVTPRRGHSSNWTAHTPQQALQHASEEPQREHVVAQQRDAFAAHNAHHSAHRPSDGDDIARKPSAAESAPKSTSKGASLAPNNNFAGRMKLDLGKVTGTMQEGAWERGYERDVTSSVVISSSSSSSRGHAPAQPRDMRDMDHGQAGSTGLYAQDVTHGARVHERGPDLECGSARASSRRDVSSASSRRDVSSASQHAVSTHQHFDRALQRLLSFVHARLCVLCFCLGKQARIGQWRLLSDTLCVGSCVWLFRVGMKHSVLTLCLSPFAWVPVGTWDGLLRQLLPFIHRSSNPYYSVFLKAPSEIPHQTSLCVSLSDSLSVSVSKVMTSQNSSKPH